MQHIGDSVVIWDKIIEEYDRIDVSKGIHINKRSASKECDVCHY